MRTVNVRVYLDSSICNLAEANTAYMNELNRRCKKEQIEVVFYGEYMKVTIVSPRNFKVPAKVKDKESLERWVNERIEAARRYDEKNFPQFM